jgi:hypothetical protein
MVTSLRRSHVDRLLSMEAATVGTPVTRRPPCRPGRAGCPPPVPRLPSLPRRGLPAWRAPAGRVAPAVPVRPGRAAVPCRTHTAPVRSWTSPAGGAVTPTPPWTPDALRVAGASFPDRVLAPCQRRQAFLVRQRQRSGVAGSGSEARASAGSRRLQRQTVPKPSLTVYCCFKQPPASHGTAVPSCGPTVPPRQKLPGNLLLPKSPPAVATAHTAA